MKLKSRKLITGLVAIAMMMTLSLFSVAVASPVEDTENAIFVGDAGFDLDIIQVNEDYLNSFYNYWSANPNEDIIVKMGNFVFNLNEYTLAGEPADIAAYAIDNPATVPPGAAIEDPEDLDPGDLEVIDVSVISRDLIFLAKHE